MFNRLKRQLMPPCRECKHCKPGAYELYDGCTNQKGLLLLEKLRGFPSGMRADEARATKFCNFKQKGSDGE